MQIALFLSDRLKSLSVIKMFSEYSFGISSLVRKFFPMVGSISSGSFSSPQVSLVSLSFFIIKFFVCVSSAPPRPRTEILMGVSVDDAELRLFEGISSGRSVATRVSFLHVFSCRYVDLLLAFSLIFACWPVIYPLPSLYAFSFLLYSSLDSSRVRLYCDPPAIKTHHPGSGLSHLRSSRLPLSRLALFRQSRSHRQICCVSCWSSCVRVFLSP